jgi:hypothetical protein
MIVKTGKYLMLVDIGADGIKPEDIDTVII